VRFPEVTLIGLWQGLWESKGGSIVEHNEDGKGICHTMEGSLFTMTGSLVTHIWLGSRTVLTSLLT
jgi:hypothetical protein